MHLLKLSQIKDTTLFFSDVPEFLNTLKDYINNSYLKQLKMKQEFKIISDFIEKNTRVLDVGCGDGTLMEYLKTNKEIDIRGIEISKIILKSV